MPALSFAHLRPLLVGAAVTSAYVGTAKIGLTLDVTHGVITPVWAPSGIALAALLILGLRYWPAVALGAFVANATSDVSLAVAAGIAFGNTLAAVLGAALVRRLGFRPELDRVTAVLALVAGALASTAVSATNGVTVLTVAGEREDAYGSAWLLWWFGDLVGDVMVAPALLVLYAFRHVRPAPIRLLEGLALLGAVAGVSAVVFLAGAWRYPYLVFPFLLWAALRFRQVGAAVTSLLVGAIVTWGAVAGTVPLGAETATGRVQVAQALFAVVAVSLLVVGAALAEREADRASLLETASRLQEAQAIAHIGSWEWDFRRDAVSWSEELYGIFGLSPASGPGTYAGYLERVHPDDRAFVQQAVAEARAELRPFAFEHRILRPDGAERVVSSSGRVSFAGDEPVAMVGTAQDVTEQRQAERLREDILSAVSHELRTPLTAVLGFAITLEERRDGLPKAEVDGIVAELGRAARRLDHLLADLLDIERLRRGLVGVTRQATDMGDLVGRVVAASSLDGRQVRISGRNLVAHIDAGKVERIVENLVVNAARHTPPQSPIEIRLEARDRDLLLVVEDGGPGIPDEFKEAVFETFHRGPGVLTLTPGTGIGLSLVARLAGVHGGRAWVEDAPAGGAAFHVLLPDCVAEGS
ncbi:MAG: MASE1 domain-containing protein [Gaiellaceae bacterium]